MEANRASFTKTKEKQKRRPPFSG